MTDEPSAPRNADDPDRSGAARQLERPATDGSSIEIESGWAQDVEAQAVADLGASLSAQVFRIAHWIRTGEAAAVQLEELRLAIEGFLDRQSAANREPDALFNWIGTFALPRHEARLVSLQLWEAVLGWTHDWERRTGRTVHKGSGYYFAGVRDAAVGDYDRAFMYMHGAALEDARLWGRAMPETPAVWFLTFHGASDSQAYVEQVRIFERSLETFLAMYRQDGRGALTLLELRQTFVRHPELIDVLTTLTHALTRMLRLGDEALRPVRNSGFADLILGQVALEFCLCLEELLKRFGQPGDTLGRLLQRFPRGHDVAFDSVSVSTLAAALRLGFDTTMTGLLSSSGQPAGRPMSDRERDLALAYGVRNRVAHGLERTGIAAEFNRIVQRCLYALFMTLETLYSSNEASNAGGLERSATKGSS